VKTAALDVRFPSGSSADDRDLAAAALFEFQTAAIHEVSDTEWRVFFRRPEERARALAVIGQSFEAAPVDVDDEDWARRSQESLRAIKVGELIVAPPWDVPPSGPAIVIEPSMGFGTAHHATTRLCLRALQHIDLEGRRVLDIGTGSGVLAIAAAKLGAVEVTGVDNDTDALAAARDNIDRNSVVVELRQADLQRDRLPTADVVLANLTGALLQRRASDLAALARGGVLIVSGFLEEEVDGVRAALGPFASGFQLEHEEGWASFSCAIA
jgi:ribosomal protein L11 methyltransferase